MKNIIKIIAIEIIEKNKNSNEISTATQVAIKTQTMSNEETLILKWN